MKCKIHILYPSEWVAYSPTILNLAEVLAEDNDVIVTCFDNGKYNNSGLDSARFNTVRVPYANFFLLAALGQYGAYKRKALHHCVRRESADILVGVDSIGIAAALDCSPRAHFLSLEISRDVLFNSIDWGRVDSVAIQTQERLDYLFPGKKPDNVFFLPNSPRKCILEPVRESSNSGRNFRAVLLGNLIPSHGLYICIDALDNMDALSLVLKGNISAKIQNEINLRYGRLLDSGRLLIDASYTPQSELIDYLIGFDVGLCFYDFDRILKNDFNYLSSPSGKMHAYIASGVPVIGSDIVGLRLVREFNAGVLLRECSPESICAAVEQLRKGHEKYRKGCMEAARACNFDAHVAPYKTFLLSSSF